MIFWVKDAAFQAGVTPSLPAAQDYFRRARVDIEDACAAGRLRCSRNGDGLLPPMELRWIRAYVAEGYRLAHMSLVPELYPKVALPDVELPPELRSVYEAMGIPTTSTPPSATLAGIREAVVRPHHIFAAALLAAALLALGVRLWIADAVELGPIALIGVGVALYSVIRLAALTYIAVYLGAFTSRIVFSTYTLSILVALPFTVETIQAWRKARVA
jgi:hypothetical protein